MKKTISLEVWEPDPNMPGALRYAYGRKAIDVFNELNQHLKDTGFLPDEYFLMGIHWENRSIPKEAWFTLDVDWGGSEGIYLDMNLYWDENNTFRREPFITGKTLGETDDDMDKMFLIASAIRKVFR